MATNITVSATEKIIKIDGITLPKNTVYYVPSGETFTFNFVGTGGQLYAPVKYSNIIDPEGNGTAVFATMDDAKAWFDENFFKAPGDGGIPTVDQVLGQGNTGQGKIFMLENGNYRSTLNPEGFKIENTNIGIDVFQMGTGGLNPDAAAMYLFKDGDTVIMLDANGTLGNTGQALAYLNGAMELRTFLGIGNDDGGNILVKSAGGQSISFWDTDAQNGIQFLFSNFSPSADGTVVQFPVINTGPGTGIAQVRMEYSSASSSASDVVLFNKALAAGKAASIETEVIVYMGSGPNADAVFSQRVKALFKNVGGTTTLVGGSAQEMFSRHDVALEDMGVTLSVNAGTDMRATLVRPIGLTGSMYVYTTTNITLSL